MKLGTKVYIVDDDLIGVLIENDHLGKPTKAKVGDRIIDIAGKTIRVLTWIVELILFIKKFIK